MIIKVSIPNRFQLKTIPSFRTVLMPRQGEVHYIGGADILPAPLETEEEGRMISLLGSEDDKEARCRLPRYLTKPRQRRSEWDMAGSDGISRVSTVFRGKSLLTNKMRII